MKFGIPVTECTVPVFFLLSVLAQAQPATKTAPPLTNAEVRGKQVIDDAVAALGGQKFLSMEDRIESGRAYSFYRDQISGLSIATIYTRYRTVAEGKTGEDLGVWERESFGKNEESGYVLFRENKAWEVTFHGANELEQDRFDRYRDTTLHDLLYLLRMRLHEPGMIFESRGTDVVENQTVEIVDITDSQNRVITAYFHHITKLPVKEVWVWRDPKTKERNEEVTRYARYQEANGIQWPEQITRDRNGDKIYQIFADSVLINQDLTDSLFAVPNGPAQKVKPPPKKK